MKEFIATIRANLDAWGELTEVVLNAGSLLCIVAGVILSLVRGIQQSRRSTGAHPLHTYFRMTFGGWLVVALEFQLAADIVGTIVSHYRSFDRAGCHCGDSNLPELFSWKRTKGGKGSFA
jgi:uncharacterized membrane protein